MSKAQEEAEAKKAQWKIEGDDLPSPRVQWWCPCSWFVWTARGGSDLCPTSIWGEGRGQREGALS
jgi:hypothetical protein